MVAQKQRLGEILVSADILTEEELQKGIDHQQNTGQKLGDALRDLDLITGVELAAALSTQLNIPYVRLEDYDLTRDIVSEIPKEVAEARKIIPIEVEPDKIIVALSDPLDIASMDEIKMMVGKEVEAVIAVEEEIEEALMNVYGTEHEIESVIDEASEDDIDVVSDSGSDLDQDSEEEMVNKTPVVKLVNQILLESIKTHASDIHLEPFEHKFMVRLRIDGVLHELSPPPKQFQSAILSRVKVMADMDIAETRMPQDGSIKVNLGGQMVNFRVSTLPTVFGESVVLRPLIQDDIDLEPANLGMSEEQEEKFTEIIERPNGIILNTGPTSSGKSTTLFAGLNYIKDMENKIITLEDPVEYRLPGIIQTEVNEKAGYTFADGMRAMLRQDPDIALVGEIRDMETAEIAVQASLTGHLVLSTVHTNQAAGAMTRLINMGVQPFLITSTIQAVLAQRLVRIVCDNCRESYEPEPESLRQISKDPNEWMDHEFSQGAGCAECDDTGYTGRTGIFELLTMSPSIRDLVNAKASATEIHEKAVEEGMMTLTEHGWQKVLDGVTSVEEILRVAPSETDLNMDVEDMDIDEEIAQYL